MRWIDFYIFRDIIQNTLFLWYMPNETMQQYLLVSIRRKELPLVQLRIPRPFHQAIPPEGAQAHRRPGHQPDQGDDRAQPHRPRHGGDHGGGLRLRRHHAPEADLQGEHHSGTAGLGHPAEPVREVGAQGRRRHGSAGPRALRQDRSAADQLRQGPGSDEPGDHPAREGASTEGQQRRDLRAVAPPQADPDQLGQRTRRLDSFGQAALQAPQQGAGPATERGLADNIN